jgi:nitrate reductase NapE component
MGNSSAVHHFLLDTSANIISFKMTTVTIFPVIAAAPVGLPATEENPICI